ncbi:MAG TPA: hypothetical protein VJG30_01415 [Candidatus Nanoarchaeia archaeon]|nr:hypothetical protein [Candidatus Nanoarchaeia archaeon]
MKKIMLILFVLSILILAACSKPGTEGTSSESGDSFAGSLANALKLGKSMKCTATDQQGNKLEFYVKGEKFRSEGTTQGTKAYTVMDQSKCMWTWQEGNNQGIKLCVPEEKETQPTSSPQAAQGQVKTDVNVDCKATSVSDSMFVPPSNVQFTDLQETLNQAMSSVPNVPSGANMPEMPSDLGNEPSSDSGY